MTHTLPAYANVLGGGQRKCRSTDRAYGRACVVHSYGGAQELWLSWVSERTSAATAEAVQTDSVMNEFLDSLLSRAAVVSAAAANSARYRAQTKEPGHRACNTILVCVLDGKKLICAAAHAPAHAHAHTHAHETPHRLTCSHCLCIWPNVCARARVCVWLWLYGTEPEESQRAADLRGSTGTSVASSRSSGKRSHTGRAQAETSAVAGVTADNSRSVIGGLGSQAARAGADQGTRRLWPHRRWC